MEVTTQEFVAIDRFHGGGKNSAKFNADHAVSPVLNGWISVDLERLSLSQSKDAAMGLIIYLLRDLAEGDITFGAKSSIGFGRLFAGVAIDGVPYTEYCGRVAGADISGWLDAFNKLYEEGVPNA